MKAATKKKNAQKKVAKKTLEESEEEVEDISVLGHSLSVGVRGVRELIRAVSEGTGDFQEIVFNECGLIYECKVCLNLFRSVANFISHKRRYCRRKFRPFHDDFSQSQMLSCVDAQSSAAMEEDPVAEEAAAEPPTPSTVEETEAAPKRVAERIPSPNVSPGKRLRTSATRKSDKVNKENVNSSRISLEFEPVPETQAVMFQTASKSENIKSQLLELDRAKERAPTLLPDGTLDAGEEGESYKCLKCQATFPTQSALQKHTVVFHQKRMCFPCPLCKMYMATAWGVYRHLSKAHRKTEEQIRKYRPTILAKATKRELYQPMKPSDSIAAPVASATARTEDEKWMAEFEGELHCTVCGKCFTRRAALVVHTASCKPKPSKTNLSPAPARPYGPLKCDNCNMEFLRKAVFTAHRQNCTGQKPQQPLRANVCRYCGRAFPRRRPLLVHQTNCPRGQTCSPNRHLMTPPKLLYPNPAKVSPSAIQVRRDYNKRSTMPPLRSLPILTQRLPLTKLESVVRKLHAKPSTSRTNGSPSPIRVRRSSKKIGPIVIQPKNGLRLSLPSVDVLNKLTLVQKTTDPVTIESEEEESNDATPPMSPVLEALLDSSPKKVVADESNNNQSSIEEDEDDKVEPEEKDEYSDEEEVVLDLKSNCSEESEENATTVEIIEITLEESEGENDDGRTDDLEDGEIVFLEPENANEMAEESPTADDVSEPEVVHTSSVEKQQETDSDVMSLASRGTERSEDSNSGSGGSDASVSLTVPRAVADDSGVSDDGSLPDSQPKVKRKSFTGFDYLGASDYEPKILLRKAVDGLQREINSWTKKSSSSAVKSVNGICKSVVQVQSANTP